MMTMVSLNHSLNCWTSSSKPAAEPFFLRYSAAAVSAGKHVYLAKPQAVDVPGCQSISESGRKATEKKLCFLVDFQTRAHPDYQEVVRRVHRGDMGRIISGKPVCFTLIACFYNGDVFI